MMKRNCALAAGAVTLCLQGHALGQTAEADYHSRFFLSGFISRSTMVCDRDHRQALKLAVAIIGDKETRAFLAGFPQTAQQWAQEGSGTFNTGVLKDGIPAACAYAEQLRAKAKAKIGAR